MNIGLTDVSTWPHLVLKHNIFAQYTVDLGVESFLQKYKANKKLQNVSTANLASSSTISCLEKLTLQPLPNNNLRIMMLIIDISPMLWKLFLKIKCGMANTACNLQQQAVVIFEFKQNQPQFYEIVVSQSN